MLFITRKFPPARGGMEEFSAQLAASYPGATSVCALQRGQRWLPLFILRALARAVRERSHTDVVHLGDGLLAPLAPIVRTLTGRPVSCTVHGQEITRSFPGYRAVMGWGLRSCGEGVIAVSNYTAMQAGERYGRVPHVITNGVDTSRFRPRGVAREERSVRQQLGVPPEGPLVVTVGRLVERKGVSWFIASVLPLLDPSVIYVVAGDGPDARNVLTAAAANRNVVLLGAVSANVIDRLYGVADLFVAPNIAVPGKPEGYGIAPAEAAAVGVPVLASAVDGLVDMARDTGVPLVPPQDAPAWATMVSRALTNGDSARPTKPPRSWHVVADDYARAFARLRPAT